MIARAQAESYVSQRIQQGAAASTVNREMTVLKHMLARAVSWEYLGTNRVAGLKPLREPSGRTRFLSLEEIERLLAACEDSISPCLRSFVVVALNTGMRRNEILELTRRSVDWVNRVATLADTKNGEARYVYLNDAALEALRRQLSGDVGCRCPRPAIAPRSQRPAHDDEIQPFVGSVSASGGERRSTWSRRAAWAVGYESWHLFGTRAPE